MSFRRHFLADWSLLVVLAGLTVLPHPALSDDLTAEAYVNRGDLLAAQGEYGQAIADYQRAIALRLQHPDAYNNLAWVWATALYDEVRNGANAVEYATKACELSDWKNAAFIDTLASAYAEVGDFDSAIEWQWKAIELDPRDELRQRLDLYLEGKPYRQSLPELKPRGPIFDERGREYFKIQFETDKYTNWYTGYTRPESPQKKRARRIASLVWLFGAVWFCSIGGWLLAAPDTVWKWRAYFGSASGLKVERTALWDQCRVITGAVCLGGGVVCFLVFLAWVI